MRRMKQGWRLLRVIYGAFFLAVGISALASVFGYGNPPEQPTKPATEFMQALSNARFVDPLLALSFMGGGGLLLFNRTAPLGLLMLAPSVVVILFFHLVLSGQYFWGTFVAAYFLLLGWRYRRAFVPLWNFGEIGREREKMD